jgi:hypothetical protein
MLRCLAIVSGLAVTSIFSVATAYADCKHNFAHCDQMAVFVCRDRQLGYREFVGGSDEGRAADIARDKAIDAGYDIGNCKKRTIYNQAR